METEVFNSKIYCRTLEGILRVHWVNHPHIYLVFIDLNGDMNPSPTTLFAIIYARCFLVCPICAHLDNLARCEIVDATVAGDE